MSESLLGYIRTSTKRQLILLLNAGLITVLFVFLAGIFCPVDIPDFVQGYFTEYFELVSLIDTTYIGYSIATDRKEEKNNVKTAD